MLSVCPEAFSDNFITSVIKEAKNSVNDPHIYRPVNIIPISAKVFNSV